MTTSAAGTGRHGPALVAQTWCYEFTRPKQMGWPTIPQSRGERSEPSKVAPVRIRVTIRRLRPADPEIARVAVDGHWLRTGRPVRGQTLAIERGQHTAIGCDAPDWVMALATEALNLAARALDEQVRAS